MNRAGEGITTNENTPIGTALVSSLRPNILYLAMQLQRSKYLITHLSSVPILPTAANLKNAQQSNGRSMYSLRASHSFFRVLRSSVFYG